MRAGSFGRAVVLSLVFFGSCTGTLVGTASWAYDQSIEPVEGSTPPTFPVVAVTGSGEALEAHPLWARQLDAFVREHPGVRFRIPGEREDELREAMMDGTRMRGAEPAGGERLPPWFADFEIEESGPGGQVVRAAVTYDSGDVNEGWYRATDGGFEPLRHRTELWPGVGILAGILGIFVGTVVLAVVGRLWPEGPEAEG